MENKTQQNKIFRQEAMDFQKNRWLGDALLISELRPWVVFLASVLIISLFLMFIIFAHYTRRINVTGEVISNPQAMNIFAPQQGFVAKIYYATGEYVKKGSILVELDVSRNNKTGNVSQQSLTAIEQQLQSLKRIMQKLAENKASNLKSLEDQLQQQIRAQQQSREILNSAKHGEKDMKKMADDYAQYLKQGWVNREQVNQLKYLYYEQQMSTENQNSKIVQQSLSINDLQKEILLKTTDYDNQILQHQVQYDDLMRQLAEVKANDILVMKAPQDGYLENMSVTQGQMVNNGDTLAQLSPNKNNNYAIVLWLPNNSIPYIRVGDQVNLRFDAFPYEKFGQFSGKIQSISHVPAAERELAKYASAPKDAHSSVYKVLIQPKYHHIPWQGRQLSLSAGMQTQSTVFLEKRSIYQWMIAPFYKIETSIGGAVHE